MKADGWVIFFVSLGACALIANVWALRTSITDRRIVRASGTNGGVKAAATQAVWREWRRVWVQSLLVAGGIVGLFAAQPPEPYASSTARIILRFVFVCMQIALAEAAVADYQARRRILEAEDEHTPQL